MIVIGGTQRSGTSLMAQLLEASGYDLDSEEGDEVGTAEHELTCGFFRDYLGDDQFPYDTRSWPHATPEQFAAIDLKVIKFAYLLMNPVFISVWHKFRPPSRGDSFLILNRVKDQVVKSKYASWKWFSHDSPMLLQDAVTLEWNFRVCLGMLKDYEYPIEVLPFPGYLKNFEFVNRILVLLDPTVQITRKAWDDTIDHSRSHTR